MGRSFVNTQISTAALIRGAALVLLALNKVYVYTLTLTELGSGVILPFWAILNFLDLFGTVFIKFIAILLLKSVHILQVKFDFM